MYREKKTVTPSTFLRNYAPFKLFLLESCPIFNSNTVENIFMKLGTNINHHLPMCREKEP